MMLPIQFEYMYDAEYPMRVRVTILQQFKQHYTGETVYRVREESDEGWVDECIYLEAAIRDMLARRVKPEGEE